MQQASFVGCSSGGAFPTALPGTLIDADKAAALAKGVTTDSRQKISTAPLQPVFLAKAAGIPACADPL